jgi:hypothetical protein
MGALSGAEEAAAAVVAPVVAPAATTRVFLAPSATHRRVCDFSANLSAPSAWRRAHEALQGIAQC